MGSGPNGLPPPRDGITFHGRVAGEAALAAHYRACDVFVSPATGQESFGIVLLEAMASGRPVICSDIDGYREVLPVLFEFFGVLDPEHPVPHLDPDPRASLHRLETFTRNCPDCSPSFVVELDG